MLLASIAVAKEKIRGSTLTHAELKKLAEETVRMIIVECL